MSVRCGKHHSRLAPKRILVLHEVGIAMVRMYQRCTRNEYRHGLYIQEQLQCYNALIQLQEHL